MNKLFSVARWEYVEKVRSKAFLIGLFLTPLIMIGMGILPGLLAGREDTETRVIGVVDATGSFAQPLADRLQRTYLLPDGRPNYRVRVIASGKGIDLDNEIAIANRLALADEVEGFVVIPGDAPADSIIEYRAKSVGDFRVESCLGETLRGIIEERRAQALGLTPGLLEQLKVRLSVNMVKLSKEGTVERAGFERVFFSSFIFMMMMFFLIATSGQLLVRSVIEEKSNRIVEVLVSSCSPTQLMAGKVLGLSALGFTQMGFWALIGVAASLQFGFALVDPSHALLLVVYFVLGYLFYAAVFIGAGSPLNTEQEAQQVNSYLIILMVLPIALAVPAMKNPDAPWLQVLTYIPFLTPTMMALRIPIQTPSLVEIVATTVLMVVSTYGAMVVAGRIFRIGILSTGKSPRLAEIARWAKGK